MKKSIIRFLFLSIILWVLVGIIKHPKLSLDSAADGLSIWFNIIIPSLFPFFIVSELLIGIGFVEFIGRFLEPLMKPLFNTPGTGAFSFSMSIVSGYPVGAKIVSNLRANKKLSKIDAERTIGFSSTSGPSFMLGAVSVGMLNNPSIAPLIIYPHYLGAITLGFILRFYKRNKNNKSTQNRINNIKKTNPIILQSQKDFSIGSILANSVKNSINTITLIGGFMIFYSVLTELLFTSNLFNHLTNWIGNISPIDINIEIIKGFIAGLLEITTGCKKIATANIDLIYKIIIINFLIGWSGFSIHSQALSFISNTDIDSKIYLLSKFLHGIFASLYCLLLYKLKYKNVIKPSFLPQFPIPESMYYLEWPELLISSFKLAILITIYMLVSSLILLIIYYFFSED